MTTEAALVERRRAADGHIDKINKRKRCRRRAKPAAVPMALQRLFLSCRDVFKGPGTVPSPSDVRNLCDIIDIMMPEDVGLCRDLQFFKPRSHVKGTPRVTCTTIYNCQNFSLCIFFLPPTAVIPLHNHPGMTVFSKLLLGTMHIKSYDWADPVNSDDSMRLSQRHDFAARLAKLKVDKIYTAPCDTSVLYPTSGGNIHAFTAITPCAVLDVLGPPYSKEDGRDCSYYRDTPYAALPNGATGMAVSKEGDSYGWLEEIEMPKDSQMDGIEYLGPQVIETNF
ncbi:cysteamine dioxygenase [Sarracenia purpurea var. burkii]